MGLHVAHMTSLAGMRAAFDAVTVNAAKLMGLDGYGLESIRVSERDLLDGTALAAAELPEPEEGAAPPGAYTCC